MIFVAFQKGCCIVFEKYKKIMSIVKTSKTVKTVVKTTVVLAFAV